MLCFLAARSSLGAVAQAPLQPSSLEACRAGLLALPCQHASVALGCLRGEAALHLLFWQHVGVSLLGRARLTVCG